MSISDAEVKKQFNRAKKLGWLPHFEEAANRITKGYFDAADLMGIASRESNLNPLWLTKAGDRGNGFGLMQADKRSFPDFVKSGKWQDAREGILKGAEILMQKLADTQDSIGKRRSVKSSKTGKLSHFTGKDVRGVELQQVTIAAYNAGRWGHYAVSTGKHVDTFTTGKDYSSDAMARGADFRKLLKQESAAAQPMPAQGSTTDQAGTSVEQNASTGTQAGPDGVPQSQQPPTTQIAENIVNTGDKQAPDNFVPERKEVSAPAKEGATANATKMTIAGIVLPSFVVAAIKGIQDLVQQGYLNSKEIGDAVLGFIFANQKYVFLLIALLIVLLMLKKAFKQVTLWLEMWIKSNPNRHDVEVKKQ